MADTPVILFDLYGTLILTLEHVDAWDAWHRKLIGFAENLGGDGSQARALLEDFWEGADPPGEDGLTIFEGRLSQFLEKQSLETSPVALGKLAGDLCDTWQGHLEVDPQAMPLFAQLSPTYRTGLVTNFDHPPHVYKLLSQHGLDGCFETIVISAEERVKKPDPQILNIACERMGCEPARTLYVGDSIVDYEAATGAGITPVIIRRGGQTEIENSRDRNSKFYETDKFLFQQASEGKLDMISSLAELPDVAAKVLGG